MRRQHARRRTTIRTTMNHSVSSPFISHNHAASPHHPVPANLAWYTRSTSTRAILHATQHQLSSPASSTTTPNHTATRRLPAPGTSRKASITKRYNVQYSTTSHHQHHTTTLRTTLCQPALSRSSTTFTYSPHHVEST